VVLSHLKQIGLSVIMFINDHDDIYALDQATLKAKTAKFMRGMDVWVDADGKPLDVRINPAILGKSMTVVANPASTVMLSLGPKDNLQFMGESTAVVFCDGHAKFVGRTGVASLGWKLK
jgi:hypothetical protein